ncbi:MAG TPA: hypothetical protein VIM10_18970 [Actinopolymorphaceae bacterium]
MTVDQSSFDLAVRRRTQLTAAIVLAVLACAFALAALIGGTLSAVIVVIGTILTGAALATSLRSWRGATEVWSGSAAPAELHRLVQRSVLPSLPVLLVSFGVTIAVAVPPLSRLFSNSTAAGNARWTDAVLLLSVVLYVFASAGAAFYPLHVRR